MVAHYSELQGASGRQAQYRPKRYRSNELLSPRANPQLRVGEGTYPVVDFSTNGAALLVSTDEPSWPVGLEVDASLILHGHEAQRLRTRVVRTEPAAGGLRVGLNLTQGFLDLESVQRLDANALLDQNLSLGPASRGAALPSAFKEAVADMVDFMQYYRQCLEPHEEEARIQGRHAVSALAARAYRWVAPRYTELRQRASRTAEAFLDDRNMMEAAKRYTETMLTPLLISAPIVWRTYKKPLGYPGDYQAMLYCYANEFEGETAFAQVVHKVFVENPLSAGVRTRKDYVVSSMRRELDRFEQTAPHGEFAVTSLGCGPAREVSDFVSAQHAWQSSIRWRLIDQEERTLQIAHEGAQRALATTGSRGAVECLNLSFGQLLRNPSLLTSGGPQSLMYATGLFDYLAVRTARQLISTMYSCLAPGGVLLIANASGPNDYFFCAEFVVDWSLIYRTREDMRELSLNLPAEAEVDVELEPTGAFWFLRIRKGTGR